MLLRAMPPGTHVMLIVRGPGSMWHRRARDSIRVGLGPRARSGIDVWGRAGQGSVLRTSPLHSSGGAPPDSPARQKPRLGVSRTEDGQPTGGAQGHLPSV